MTCVQVLTQCIKFCTVKVVKYTACTKFIAGLENGKIWEGRWQING